MGIIRHEKKEKTILLPLFFMLKTQQNYKGVSIHLNETIPVSVQDSSLPAPYPSHRKVKHKTITFCYIKADTEASAANADANTAAEGSAIPYSTFLAPCALNFFRVAANF